MKLTKTVWMCLGAGMLVLALALLGVARFQQITEQERLKDELAVVQNRLVGLELGQAITQKEQLQEQLNQENTKLQDIKNIVAKPVTSISGDERLFALARDCNVTITDISASETYDTKLNDIPSAAFSITANVNGSISDLVNFITRLKTDFINSMVESADITVPDETGTDLPSVTIEPVDTIIPEETGTGLPSAIIKLMIYTYKGS
ncbi:MAG: hypothetical protein PHY28_02605 [Dehalococcoidales bacterium]|nr:hypothetical protein [Dehalococcoidales bacterium]